MCVQGEEAINFRTSNGHRSIRKGVVLSVWRRKMNTRFWKTLIVLVALSLVIFSLAACGPKETVEPTTAPVEKPPEEVEEEPPEAEPITLRVGATTIWDAISPATGWESYTLRYWFHDGLIEWAEMQTFEPGLAESWTVSDDGLVWEFKIREGLTFHDGTSADAEAIAWSFNFLMDGMIGPLELYVTGFEEVVALDSTTVQITLSEPTALMLTARLHYAWILPRSVWEGMTYDDIMEFEDIAAVIGTGPYKLVEYVEDEYMIAEANEDYYRGKPVIDRIVIQQYATEDATVQALLAGEVDLILEVPYTAVQPLQEAENIEVVIMSSLSLDDLVINSHVNGTQPESLNDPAVRLAIDYAIDKQE
ncbi:MAG: ABC transporter substrate-binding protein, partial [Anaerolineales bacterium]|nr:ABC transporter substrate-binding protein [Anaerolineales bacterium]